MTSQSYPSGLTVETNHDEAGRVAGVMQAAGGYFTGAGPSDPDRPEYSPHGAVSSRLLGNGLWEYVGFNSRLQAEQIRLWNGATNLLALNYGYGSANNSGNVLSQQIAMPGLSLTQNYAYDTHEAFVHQSKLSSNPFLQHLNLQGIPGSGLLAHHSCFVERRGTPYDSRLNVVLSCLYIIFRFFMQRSNLPHSSRRFPSTMTLFYLAVLSVQPAPSTSVTGTTSPGAYRRR